MASISRREATTVAAAGAALLAAFLVARYPPMIDLPMHEAAVALLRRYGDPLFAPRSIYTLNLGRGGQLFHVLAAALAFPLSVEHATKAVVVASVVGVVWGTARLARHAGKTTAVCLLVGPVAIGWTMLSGFAPNLLGQAILLLALPAMDRAAEEPSARRALGVAGLLVLLHAAHDSMLIAGCAAVAVLGLTRSLDRRAALRLAPLVAGAALLAYEFFVERARATAYSAHWSGVVWHPLGTKLANLDDTLFGPLEGVAALAAKLLTEGSLAWLVWSERRRLFPGADAPGGRLRAWRFGLLAAALALLFLAMPYAVNYGVLLYVRFLAPAYAIGLVALAPPAGERPPEWRARTALWGAAAAATVAMWVQPFAQADAGARALDTLLARIEPGSATASVLLWPVTNPFLPSQGERALALRGGRALHSLTEYPNAPVVMRAEARWDEPLLRVSADPLAFEPARDFRAFRYVLVFVPDPRATVVVERAFAPEGRVLGEAGAWVLFESTGATVPIDARAPAPPPRRGATVGDRLKALLR
jgi:hypothetical protein